MNDETAKFHLRQQEAEETSLLNTEQHQQKHEFASVEEMIRTDRDQTEVPTAVAERVNVSIAAEPKREPSWWKKLFGA